MNSVTEDKALEGIAVSPPVPADEDAAAPATGSPVPNVREGTDAESHDGLKADPSDADAKLDIGLDETFPSSDAPANTQPGGDHPVPSTGFDEVEEQRLADERGDTGGR
jgi:hypothetical protein